MEHYDTVPLWNRNTFVVFHLVSPGNPCQYGFVPGVPVTKPITGLSALLIEHFVRIISRGVRSNEELHVELLVVIACVVFREI